MLKITAILSLMLIATWSHADIRRAKKEATAPEEDSGSMSASLSCDSCGSECTSACGTRHFRSCCFNYLRRKKADPKLLDRNTRNLRTEQPLPHLLEKSQKLPVFFVETVPEHLYNMVPNDFKPYPFEDTIDNRVQVVYDV